MSKIIKITAFFMFFVMCFCMNNLYAALAKPACLNTQTSCCPNGVWDCCPKKYDASGRELQYDVSACLDATPILPDVPIVRPNLCTAGATQEKYTASGCTYSTSKRTCCSNLSWSDWDEECCSGSSCCTSSQCWNGSSCETKGSVSRSCSISVANATGGTQTRSAVCKTSGWYYGTWSGTCTCATGYKWNGSSCTKTTATCKITSCPSGEYLVNPGTAQCCCENNYCGSGGYCKCPKLNDNDMMLGYGWVKAGNPCWSQIECGTGTLPDCNERNAGSYASVWDSSLDSSIYGCGNTDRLTRGACQQYECRYGG